MINDSQTEGGRDSSHPLLSGWGLRSSSGGFGFGLMEDAGPYVAVSSRRRAGASALCVVRSYESAAICFPFRRHSPRLCVVTHSKLIKTIIARINKSSSRPASVLGASFSSCAEGRARRDARRCNISSVSATLQVFLCQAKFHFLSLQTH